MSFVELLRGPSQDGDQTRELDETHCDVRVVFGLANIMLRLGLGDEDNEADMDMVEGAKVCEQVAPPSSSTFPFTSHHAPHSNHHAILRNLCFDPMTPSYVFFLLFGWLEVEGIVRNTNTYTIMEKKKNWARLTDNELLIWLAITIYMDAFRVARPRDCWKADPSYPKYQFTSFMSRDRFEEIRWTLHVSNLLATAPEWFGKVEPLASRL